MEKKETCGQRSSFLQIMKYRGVRNEFIKKKIKARYDRKI